MKISFFGAAKTVTGSNYLITTKDRKIIIDCGLFQGSAEMEKRNAESFKYNPTEIDYVFLTHAHIDHCGRLPKLVKDGYSNSIISTKATAELCEVMLMDCAKIMEYDAEWENKKRLRSGLPMLEPLYTQDAVKTCLKQFKGYLYTQDIVLDEFVRCRFRDAGHILGSAILELWVKEDGKESKFVFSGDLGMPNRPIIQNPEYIDSADYLIVESTYGDSVHEDMKSSRDELIKIILQTAQAGGSTIIPCFAVGRMQEIIYELNNYFENPATPEHEKLPIYIDSPMAALATDVFMKNSDVFNMETKERILAGDNPFSFKNLYYVRDTEESMRLNKVSYPKVIISTSGMANAGRVRHHLKHNLWDFKNSVLFVGYQAEGTTGREIMDGANKIKLLNETIDIKARVYKLLGFSAHADNPMLMGWLSGFKYLPKNIFLIHGEDDALNSFASDISCKFNIDAVIPSAGDEYELTDSACDVVAKDDEINVDLSSEIQSQLELIKKQYEAMESNSDIMLNEKYLKKNYSNLRNELLEISRELMNINLMLGK